VTGLALPMSRSKSSAGFMYGATGIMLPLTSWKRHGSVGGVTFAAGALAADPSSVALSICFLRTSSWQSMRIFSIASCGGSLVAAPSCGPSVLSTMRVSRCFSSRARLSNSSSLSCRRLHSAVVEVMGGSCRAACRAARRRWCSWSSASFSTFARFLLFLELQ